MKFFDEDFLDLLGVLILSEEVEEKVDIESALSFISERLEH